MPADPHATPFTREPLTPFAREQLWEAVRARRGVMIGNLVFTSFMGAILALLPAAVMYLLPIGGAFRIGLGVWALAGAAVTIAQARLVLQIFGPYLQALWRGQGLQAALFRRPPCGSRVLPSRPRCGLPALGRTEATTSCSWSCRSASAPYSEPTCST